ncbi:Uncharacterised protein [Sporosarcina pasteurii]|uniref:Uncharacterized protein n=1 Tax=Sporosarcina pasteurii TaxID=1474 RepID=A0A380C1L9_SPOPA|nr:Uncharacterised protein [Sporosarcina pasteurii]
MSTYARCMRGEFDWNLWIVLLIGRTIGHLVIAFVREPIEENKHDKKPRYSK